MFKKTEYLKLKTAVKYRWILYNKLIREIIIYKDKFKLLPPGKLHPEYVKRICEAEIKIDIIREIDFNDSINEQEIFKQDWDPLLENNFRAEYQKLGLPVDHDMVEHLISQFPTLPGNIYTKLNIEYSLNISKSLDGDEQYTYGYKNHGWNILTKQKQVEILADKARNDIENGPTYWKNKFQAQFPEGYSVELHRYKKKFDIKYRNKKFKINGLTFYRGG